MQTTQVLRLVEEALDQFDDRPLDATVRRAIRVASLLGETQVAVRLGLELKPMGGHPPANAETTRALMDDPSSWGSLDGPAEAAMEEYILERTIEGQSNVLGRSLAEIQWVNDEYLVALPEPDDAGRVDSMSHREFHHQVLERTRHTVFALLVRWERQLTYTNVNEEVYRRFQSAVDAVLASGAPDVLDAFGAVYRRLHEVSLIKSDDASEELAQALTTCRRILKAVVDHIIVGEPGALTADGHSLDDAAYRNRLFEFLKQTGTGNRERAAIEAEFAGLLGRFEAIDGLANKGVHADVAVREAELCAINTYVLAGEILRLKSEL